MLLLLACAKDPYGAVLELRTWQADGGSAVTAPISGARLHVTHPIHVDAAWADRPARLELDATTWRADVDIDGAAAGSGVGGNAPLWVALPKGLPAGDHLIGVTINRPAPDNLVPGRTIQELGAWTFHAGHQAGADFSGRATLRIGTAAEAVATRAWLEDGAVMVEARGPTLAGQPVHFTIVRDGAVVTDVGTVTADATGVAAASAPWTGPRWPEARFTLVATRPDGGTWTAPFGPRDVDGTNTIAVDGPARYVAAVRADWSAERQDPRTSLFTQARAAAARGASALEWHGTLYSELGFSLADELGIGIVATPRCGGRQQRNGRPGVDATRDAFLAAENDRIAGLARHPALWAWATEWEGGFATLRALDTVFFVKNDVVSIQAGQTGALKPWVVEVMTDGRAGMVYPELAASFGPHQGAGVVLPTLPTTLTAAQLAEEEQAERAMLLAKGAVPWEPGLRRGNSVVEVHGAPGTVAWLEIAAQPPVGIVIGAGQVGWLDIDASGPATVRIGEKAQPVTLTPGTWSATGFQRTPVIVR